MEGATVSAHHAPHHGDAEDIAENKDLAALSYVWVLAVVVHFSVHHSPFTRFHCRQGLVLFAFSIIASFIPVVGIVLLMLLAALSVTGFVNAAQGLRRDLPVVGPVARADIPALQHQMAQGVQYVRGMLRRKHAKHSPHSPRP